jgi:hypothetical protein
MIMVIATTERLKYIVSELANLFPENTKMVIGGYEVNIENCLQYILLFMLLIHYVNYI